MALAIVGLGQSVKLPSEFAVSYDKFKDKTDAYFIDGWRITSGFIHSGSVLKEDQAEFYIIFHGAYCTGFCFHNPSLIFIIDGEHLALPEERQLTDDALFLLDRSVIERIASAKIVEYQVGQFENKWKDKSIAKFKLLLDLGTVKK